MNDPTPDLATRLAPLLEASIVEHNVEDIAATGFVVERVGPAAHVLFDGTTVGLVEEDPLTLSLTLEARWQGVSLHEEADAAALVMDEVREPWDANGWVIDEGCKPGNGWDADERCYRLNLIRDFDSLDGVVDAIGFTVEEGTVAWIEESPEDDD